MLRAFGVPIGWGELAKRTYQEINTDNCLGLAAQLAYYFFLALFPALLFLVAVVSFFPVHDLMNTIVASLARLAPAEVLTIIRDQITKLANNNNGGLLTLGMLGTIWSTSAGVVAIIDSLNQAYDIQEGRQWWKVRLTALGLTVALAAFIVTAFALVLVGPTLAEKVAGWVHLGGLFTMTWKIVQWPVVFALVATGIGLIYYFAPDAEQDWVWLTPGSLLATLLWLVISLLFKLYIVRFGSYNATYGAIGGVIVLMLWLYLSSLAVLVGAELNAEIEHASPYGKDPGEKVPGERKKIGLAAERAYLEKHGVGAGAIAAPFITPWGPTAARASRGRIPFAALENCDIDKPVPHPAPPPRLRLTDCLLSAAVAAAAFIQVRSRAKKVGE
jgi:membrane protein